MTDTLARGLTLSVLRGPHGDATRGGLSSTHDTLVLVGFLDRRHDSAATFVRPLPGGCRITAATTNAVALTAWRPTGRVALHLCPVVPSPTGWTLDPRWLMHGGNYATTSDGRFCELLASLGAVGGLNAVPIHDRYEG